MQRIASITVPNYLSWGAELVILLSGSFPDAWDENFRYKKSLVSTQASLELALLLTTVELLF